jgi:hypothetical protein
MLRFNPPYIQPAGRGQRLHFDFRAVNHTLTESSFEQPCTKLMGAQFDTDFNNVNPGDVPDLRPFDLTLEDSRPRFFFCKQGSGSLNSHCGKGMVFAVNVDSATFAQFELNAAVDGLPKTPSGEFLGYYGGSA